MASNSRKSVKREKFTSSAPAMHHRSDVFSDSETMYKSRGPYYQYANSLPHASTYNVYSPLGHMQDPGNYTDDDGGDIRNDFGDGLVGNKLVKSGRQRKKLAARSKGGEFQTKRRKRRIYFCCISSEIDVEKLFDYLHGADDLLFGWKFEVYSDVLHIYKPAPEDVSVPTIIPRLDGPASTSYGSNHDGISLENYLKGKRERVGTQDTTMEMDDKGYGEGLHHVDSVQGMQGQSRFLGMGVREVFVFDFGAVVFWGFPRGDEAGLLKTIRMFVTKGMVGSSEFQSGEDDMAFVTSPDEKSIVIANDVITLPDETDPRQRLAVSFAIAQSSVLAIFEARIEQKVEEYKYIPETLAAVGKVHLSERQLGMMIGEVFVIRHDVNLHTEILDTPDFFWKEKAFESTYKLVSSYLEMSGRTEILNKRLDMLRELLDVLQQQMENAHGVKLEWIVIYLIVAEVVLQGLAIIAGG